MKEKRRETDNRTSLSHRTKKLIKSYMLYTNKTVENRIYILQKNREIVLMKTMYNKSKLEENENLLFNKKNYKEKTKKYI